MARLALAAPAEDAALMHRMQGVDDDQSPRDRQPGRDRATAKAVKDRGLALAGEPGFGNPAGKLG